MPIDLGDAQYSIWIVEPLVPYFGNVIASIPNAFTEFKDICKVAFQSGTTNNLKRRSRDHKKERHIRRPHPSNWKYFVEHFGTILLHHLTGETILFANLGVKIRTWAFRPFLRGFI